MAVRVNEASRLPLASASLGVAATSGTDLPTPAHYLIVNTTAAGTLTLTMMDGNTVALGTLPIGVYTFNVQCVRATWTGTMVVGAFWHTS